jgi:hypothetical protein
MGLFLPTGAAELVGLLLPLHRQERHGGGSRVDYKINLSGQSPQCIALFDCILVTIINSFDAADDVPHDALGVFARHSGAAHEAARGPSQIVQLPLRYVRQHGCELALESFLAL